MSEENQALLMKIPAVDRLLRSAELAGASGAYPRSVLLKAIHHTLDQLRAEILKGELGGGVSALSVESVASRVMTTLKDISRPSLRSVINATGVVVHTNLGRSIMAEKVLSRFRSVAGAYNNLEYDLARGMRGSRYVHVEEILKELTSAESAMVVNNNAAAVLVSLDTLAKGREVVVSRGELVEIGGSFRIPEVMRKSGAKMVEVGTTNKTHLRDYEEVIGPETALLLKVHRSNYQIIGFTEEVPLSELVGLGKRCGVPVMEDLGSGCLVDFSKYGLVSEPTVREILVQGASLVCFSGDKLLGGPQAGIILGEKGLVEGIRKNQLNRALRIDKLTLLALEQTLRLYRDERTALKEIPTLRMLCQSYGALKKKADRLTKLAGNLKTDNFSIRLMDGNSKVGGGALPLLEMPSRLVSLVPGRLSPHFMEVWLRNNDPPVITRVEKERVVLDMRTIQDRELKIVAQAIQGLASVRQE